MTDSLNFLLVSPRRPRTIAQASSAGVGAQAMFPVGLAYVSAAMKAAGFSVVTANANFLGDDLAAALAGMIEAHRIDVVCTGGQSIDVHAISEIIEISRRTKEDLRVVVGGAIVTADPETAMAALRADIGVIGEGEEAMRDIAAALARKQDIADIPGVISWRDDQLHRAPARPEVQDIDGIAMMDFDGFSYRDWLCTNGNAGIIFTARSCPFKCTFCFKSTGNKYRARSLDAVFAEIDYQVAQFGITSLFIADELFAAKKPRVVEFCRRIGPYKLAWGCSLRVPEIDADLLRLMKANGCNSVATGLESASADILKSMRKAVKIRQIEKALDVFAEADLAMTGNFIFGDIEETVATYRESVAFWRRYSDQVHINLGAICTLPGSYIYQHACANGHIADKEQFLREGLFLINISRMNDAEYYGMLSEITELSFLPQIPAAGVSIRGADADGQCDVEWTCRRCGRANALSDVHFLQAPVCICPCGSQNTVEPFRALARDADYLLTELPLEEPIGFWGVGSQYCRLVRHYDCLRTDRYIQIDANDHQQKLVRVGKKIHGPEAIAKFNLTSIVITSPIAKDAIVGSIVGQHPSVAAIFFPQLAAIDGELFAKFERIS